MKCIGITGSISSGKQTIANYLIENYGFEYHVLSHILNEEREKLGIEKTKRNMQILGNKLRREFGTQVLAERLYPRLNKEKNHIIDGIRNPGEADYFRKKLGNFYLIAVDADPKLRFERMKLRKKLTDVFTLDEFMKLNEIDLGQKSDTGQNVTGCIELADIKLLNNGTIEELHAQINEMMKELFARLNMSLSDSCAFKNSCAGIIKTRNIDTCPFGFKAVRWKLEQFPSFCVLKKS